ncbi:MAG: TetR/AcrR family transcriptional regulator [Desulfobacterales bacterium]|nr:TetR/AcrR family transcriptional regulator [Desulfobacterales bacterium]
MKRARTEAGKQIRIKEILRVAKREFIKKGYDGATIREIAGKAKLTPAALYFYFKNKDELFGTILEEVYQKELDALIEASKSEDTIYNRLLAVIKTYYEFILKEEANILEVKLKNLKLPPPLRHRIEKQSTDTFGIVIDIIKEGIKDGSITPETDPVTISFSLFSTMEGFYVYHVSGEFDFFNYKLDDALEKYLQSLCNGIFK